MDWTTLRLEVVTPLFNGGGNVGEPADEAGVRRASFRGPMRFWFRALAGIFTGPDLVWLAEMERAVFGGASGQDVGSASPVLLRIPKQPMVTAAGNRGFLPGRNDESRRLLYLMGQGLGDMGSLRIIRPYVAPRQRFDLKIGFRHRPGDSPARQAAIGALAFASLWLTCTYGGVGARTRRGFGGLRITGATDGALPAPWNADDAIRTPGLGHYMKLERLWPDGALGSCMTLFPDLLTQPGQDEGRVLDPRAAWSAQAPSFPVLSRTHAPATTSGTKFGSWEEALARAGEQLQVLRGDLLNRRGDSPAVPGVDVPPWRDVVGGRSDRFPLGALGLPVSFTGQPGDPAVNAGRRDVPDKDRQPLRRASPLWLRAVGGDRDWRLLSFAFGTEFLPGPEDLGVFLSHGDQTKELITTSEDVQAITDQWIRKQRATS